jgi:beta-phosphoglucomutase
MNMLGLIYDMDGVIVLTEDIHKKAFDITFEVFGVKSSDVDWDKRFVGKGNKYIVTNVFSDFYIQENVAEWVEKWVKNYQEIIQKEGIQIVPGFLEFNKKMGDKKVIATGGVRKNSEIVLKLLGLNYPIISSEDIVNPKPNPEIFRMAARAINVDYENCVVFEDSIYGVQAAKKAGMKVVALTTTHSREELLLESPDYIIDNFIGFELHKKVEYPSFEER